MAPISGKIMALKYVGDVNQIRQSNCNTLFNVSNAADKRNSKRRERIAALQRSYQKACDQRQQFNTELEDIERRQKILDKELEKRAQTLSVQVTERQQFLANEKITVATKSYALRRHIEYLEGCILKKTNRS